MQTACVIEKSRTKHKTLYLHYTRNPTVMVVVIKEGASEKEISEQLKNLKNRKSIDLSKYAGKIKLKEDPLAIQKKMRDEWK